MPKVLEVNDHNFELPISSEANAASTLQACKSTEELLKLKDLRRVVAAAFHNKSDSGIHCPNQQCKELFVKANLFLLHVKRCGVDTRPSDSLQENVKKRFAETLPKLFNYQDYQERPEKWACLTSSEQLDCIKRKLAECGGKPLVCLNPNCSKKLKMPDALQKHVNECFLPTYFRYLKEPSNFHLLEKQTKSRFIREALKVCDAIPCLNVHASKCTYVTKHLRSLSYHLERCGVSPEERPWRCYRCGYESASSESNAHLQECRLSETSQLLRSAEVAESRLLRLQESPTFDGKIDVPDESGEAEAGKNNRKRKFFLGIPLSNNMNYMTGRRLGTSGVLLPSRKAARITVSGNHQRFKFKNLDSNANFPPPTYQKLYSEVVRKARETFDAERKNEPLCSALLDTQYSVWPHLSQENLSDRAKELLKKKSVPFVVLGTPGTHRAESLPVTSTYEFGNVEKRLHTFLFENIVGVVVDRKTSQEAEPNVPEKLPACFTYCGGPISTISSCPRTLEDGSECVAVTVFSDEEFLIPKTAGVYDSQDYVQIFFYERKENSIHAYLGCVIETNVGVILATTWCPVLRENLASDLKSNFLGFLAVSGTQGNVAVYAFHSDFLRDLGKADELPFFCAKPAFELLEPDDEKNIPIIGLAWSPFDGAAKVAAVSASGSVCIWNLNCLSSKPTVILPTERAMAPFSVSFFSKADLAISYREKILRIYNLENNQVTVEENSSRTAGLKVYSYPRLFSGLFCYQGDNITTPDSVFSTCCYIAFGKSEKDIFVVPMPNRHEVILWDLAVCPSSGSLLTVGADGRLNLSLTGRLLPHCAEAEFIFNAGRSIMTLRRRAKNSDSENGGELKKVDFSDTDEISEVNEVKGPRKPATDLDSAVEQFYLEVSFGEAMDTKESQAYSLDLRIESLNRISASEAVGKMAICGGEAGLLFFVPF